MKPGAILVDHTASAELAREPAGAAQQQGKQFLDAPVSVDRRVENGALTVMIGGDHLLMIWPNRSSTAIEIQQAARPAGRGSTGKDGQSDLYRRRGAGVG